LQQNKLPLGEKGWPKGGKAELIIFGYRFILKITKNKYEIIW
jgi:hypothetical protein